LQASEVEAGHYVEADRRRGDGRRGNAWSEAAQD
jgi:hypothetical protein